MKKYFFKRDTLLATVMVFVIMALLSLIPLNTHVLDPIKLTLKDFDYNDLAYSRMGKNSESAIDTNIIIVNIDTASRKSIAAIIEKISWQQPAVIGVDVLFDLPKSLADDSLLQRLTNSPGIVMAYRLQKTGDATAPAGFLYPVAGHKGFANFIGEEGGVIRHFLPVFKQDDSVYTSFTATITQRLNLQKYETLMQRNRKTEVINYTHAPAKFVVLQGRQILSETEPFSLYKKIVLVGFVSEKATDVEDKHFTPMNAKSFGKSIPDMNGVLIHANILQMILSDSYISRMPTWLTWLLAFFICWLHMTIFLNYFLDRHLWFHLAAKVAQILSAVLFIYIGLIVFNRFNYAVNLAPSFVAIILAVDVLYFYEAICNWLHKKYGIQSVFSHHKHS